jgi:hypothetical protein
MSLLTTPGFKSPTEVIEHSATTALGVMIPLTIARSGVQVMIKRGGQHPSEYDIYGPASNTSPTQNFEEFLARLLVSSHTFITWSATKLNPLVGNYGFVDYAALPGDVLTHEDHQGIMRFRYMIIEAQSCGLTIDIAYRVKLLSRQD